MLRLCRFVRISSSGTTRAISRAHNIAFVEGFSLHAAVELHRNDCDGVEALYSYGLRPAIALDRISWTDDGQVRYRDKRPAFNVPWSPYASS